MPAKGTGDASQATISSFFQPSPVKSKTKKRGISPSGAIDLTADSDVEPSAKRPRRREPTSPIHGSSTSASEQWRFTSSSPDKAEARNVKATELTEAESAAKRARHEAFKKKLLLDNNPFLRKKFDVSVTPLEDGPSETSGEESDQAFKELNVMFSNKGKGKAKAPPPRTSKKPAVLGPSGQSYTPLELQVDFTVLYEFE